MTPPESPAPGRDVARDSAYERLDVTILLADLRGYTALGAQLDEQVLIGMLDRFLTRMSELVIEHHGVVDKFMGDSIMAVFGPSVPGGLHAAQALHCAARMQLAMDQINIANRALGLPDNFTGIGVNTGPVMAGWLGCTLHREYTFIGDAVNVASRIESFSLRGQVLLGDTTLQRAQGVVEVGDVIEIAVKGEPEPLKVYELVGLPAHGLRVPRRDLRRSQRVRVDMPFSFQVLHGKLVAPEVYSGTIHDIGYYGVLADLNEKAGQFDDIKLSIDLAPVGHRAADVYARVLRSTRRQDRDLWAIEFTSVTLQSDVDIRQFVQILLQGCPTD